MAGCSNCALQALSNEDDGFEVPLWEPFCQDQNDDDGHESPDVRENRYLEPESEVCVLDSERQILRCTTSGRCSRVAVQIGKTTVGRQGRVQRSRVGCPSRTYDSAA